MRTKKNVVFLIFCMLVAGMLAFDVSAASSRKCKLVLNIKGYEDYQPLVNLPYNPRYGGLKSEVYINGNYMGSYYRRTFSLDPGTKKVEIKHAGYAPYEETFECNAGEVVKRKINLKFERCILTIYEPGYPQCVYVKIDGNAMGCYYKRAFYVSAGSHTVEASYPGYETDSMTFGCEANRIFGLQFDMHKTNR